MLTCGIPLCVRAFLPEDCIQTFFPLLRHSLECHVASCCLHCGHAFFFVCVCAFLPEDSIQMSFPLMLRQMSGVSCCFVLFELLCTHFGMVKFVDKQGAVKTSIIIHTNGLTQSQLSKPVSM